MCFHSLLEKNSKSIFSSFNSLLYFFGQASASPSCRAIGPINGTTPSFVDSNFLQSLGAKKRKVHELFEKEFKHGVEKLAVSQQFHHSVEVSDKVSVGNAEFGQQAPGNYPELGGVIVQY